MAHNLMTLQNGTSGLAFNSKNGLPWHKLGQAVDGAMTWQQAMQLARLNWTVSKHQLKSPLTGNLIDAYGIFRDDNQNFLGTVGGVYTAIQNQEAFDFVDTLLEAENGAHYDTAGALGNGERIFVSASIPYSIAPNRAPGDLTNCYLMFETSHDGMLLATAKLTTIRVVCENTLSMALDAKGFGQLKLRHSASGSDKLDRAKKIIQGVRQDVQSLKSKFDLLANRKPSAEERKEIMNRIFGKDWADSTAKRNQVERIGNLFSWNDGNAFPEIKDSAYAMLQAVTNWSDHERTVWRTDSVQGMTDGAIRAQSAIFNGGDKLKTDAFDIILQATKHSNPMPEPVLMVQSAGIPMY